jgi:sugar O-acyltransferase (sialic acid O-acetyltransferase NeuD family)
MSRLLIVGAGGFARELWGWVQALAPRQAGWSTVAFLDRDPDALREFPDYGEVVGDPNTYVPRPGDVFVAGIGDGTTRLHVCRELQRRGAQFLQVIHPTAIVGPCVALGVGTILFPHAVVTANVKVGDFVVLNVHSSVGHDAVLKEGCTLSGYCNVTGNATLGSCVFMGTHAAVLPGTRVGDHASVGAGSVAFRNVPEGVTVIGVPAKNLWQAAATRVRPAA